MGKGIPQPQAAIQEPSLEPRRFDSLVKVNDMYKNPRLISWGVAAICAVLFFLSFDMYYIYLFEVYWGSLIICAIFLLLAIGGLRFANVAFKKDKPFYEIGNTFRFFRMSNAEHKSMARSIGVLAVFLAIFGVFMLFSSFNDLSAQGNGRLVDLVFILIGCGITSYLATKSLKVHEDIDYVANEDLAEIMDMTIDERVMASYQNFDSSVPLECQLDDLEGNPNLFVMTQRQIYFAFYTSNGWISNQFKLENITSLEIEWDFIHYNGGVTFQIQDGNEIKKLNFDLSLLDNLSQYPILIVRQMLNTFDAFKQGRYVEMSTKRKRRRNIANNQPTTDGHASEAINEPQEVAAWESVPQSSETAEVRSIELCKDVYNGLKNAKPGMSKRALEL